MNFWNLKVILLQLLDQLISIQLAVRSASLDNLGLLIQSKVLPCEVWADVFFEERKDFVVGDCSRVGEVVDTSIFVFGQEDGSGKEIVKDGVGVGNVDYAVVFGDLGNEVAGVEVVADWHAETEDEYVGVGFHDLLNMCLGLGVERTIKVGLVSLEESLATDWVIIIIGIDTSSSEDSDVNALLEAAIGQVESADNIVSDGLFSVVFAPINIGSSS